MLNSAQKGIFLGKISKKSKTQFLVNFRLANIAKIAKTLFRTV